MLITKGIRGFIATAVVACLALPGVASATFILDLTTFPASFTSPFTVNDPQSPLTWDLTVTGRSGLTDMDLTTDPVGGLGVDGGPTGRIDQNESIIFDFIPDVMLEGFMLTTVNGAFSYDVAGNPHGLLSAVAIGDTTVNIVSTATQLSIANVFDLGGAGFRVSALLFADAPAAGVPEPAVLGLLGFGLLGMVGVRRMKKTA